MFEAVQKSSLSDQVFEQLRGKILGKELGSGDELPSERELSETLGVNRGAVREAIKRLQQARLVRVRHGGATVVEDFELRAGLELLPSLIVDAKGKMNLEVARGMVLLRQALAPMVASQAATQAASKSGSQLADSLDAIVLRMKSSKTLPQLQVLAFEYWTEVVAHSGNLVLKLAFNSMQETYQAMWGLLTELMQEEFRDTSTLDKLSHAIRRGDAAESKRLADQHVQLGSKALEQAIDLLNKK